MVDLLLEGPVIEQPPPGPWIDRLDPRLRKVVTVLALALPVIAYFWLIHRYSVNVIFGDQWSDVAVINHTTWSNLWAQHNENRIFFPNLVMLTVAHTTHFNIAAENYLSGVMLTGSVGLLVWAHKLDAPTPPGSTTFPSWRWPFRGCRSGTHYGDSRWPGGWCSWPLLLLSQSSTGRS